MIISLIWAMADNHVIGKENRLPWRLSGDLQYFKRTTLGKPIIMGRKTFESFGARPLPGRQNIVITRDTAYQAEGADVVHSIEEALERAGDADEVFIIGGAQLYEQMIGRADRLYQTRVHATPAGDAFFPFYDESPWQLISIEDHVADDKNDHDYSFWLFKRR